MRNFYAIFDDDVKPAGATVEKTKTGEAGKMRDLSCASFDRLGRRLRLFWFSDRRPSDCMEFARLDLSARLGELRSPVWVEMITGRVFALDDVRFRTRSGQYSGWPFGLEIPKTLKVVEQEVAK